jgi:hypothetical protein
MADVQQRSGDEVMIDIPLEQAVAAINTMPSADFIVQVTRMAFKVSLN